MLCAVVDIITYIYVTYVQLIGLSNFRKTYGDQ